MKKIKNYNTYESVNGPVKIKESGEINPEMMLVKIEGGELQKI